MCRGLFFLAIKQSLVSQCLFATLALFAEVSMFQCEVFALFTLGQS